MLKSYKLNNLSRSDMREVINRSAEIANNYAGELLTEVIPLERIELDPDNNRELSLTLADAMNGINEMDPEYEKKRNDWKSLESLANTIKDNQLINPIFVYRYGNKCRLIAGERRTLASAIAGKKEIIARITDQPDGSKLRILQWIENSERMDLSLSERIASLEAILREYFKERNLKYEEQKITAQLLCDLTGISHAQARRYHMAMYCKPEIRKAIDEGHLENLKLIQILSKVENQMHQNELLQAAISGMSFESIIKLKNKLEKESLIKKEKRGTKKSKVDLGKVKPQIAKAIVESLIASNFLDRSLTEKLNEIMSQIHWDRISTIEKSFKKIISLVDSGN